MEQETKKRSFKKPLLVVGVFLLVASLAANVYFGVKMFGGGTSSVATGSVCGDEIIGKYNKLIENSESTSENHKDFRAEISKKDQNQEDINCVYLELSSAVRSGTQEEKTKYYEKTKEFVEKGIFPSIKINSLRSLSELESLVNYDPTAPRGAA